MRYGKNIFLNPDVKSMSVKEFFITTIVATALITIVGSGIETGINSIIRYAQRNEISETLNQSQLPTYNSLNCSELNSQPNLFGKCEPYVRILNNDSFKKITKKGLLEEILF